MWSKAKEIAALRTQRDAAIGQRDAAANELGTVKARVSDLEDELVRRTADRDRVLATLSEISAKAAAVLPCPAGD